MTPSQIKLISILEELLSPPAPITPEQTLGELGADSLDLVEITIAIEQDFNLRLDEEDEEEIVAERSVEQIAHWLDTMGDDPTKAPLTKVQASSY